jgi:hypothetical protein
MPQVAVISSTGSVKAGDQVGGRPSAGDSMRPWITAFVERLRDLGWIEDRTIAIAYRWAEGHPERYAEIAAEFVRLNVNVIVTTGPAAPQAKKATSVIPIVLVSARGVKTARGGEWTAVQVSDILRRAYRWAQLARSPPCAISCTWRSPPIPMALRAHSADCSRRLRP